jgi:hypothetical protein
MKKIKVFDIELTIYECAVILVGGVLIGAVIRLQSHYSIRDALATMQVSILFFSSAIICILLRIADIVHGKESERISKELKEWDKKVMEDIKRVNEEAYARMCSKSQENKK